MAGALWWGCGDRAELWQSPLRITGPYKTGKQAMWVDSSRGMVFALDPVQSAPVVRSAALRRNAVLSVPSPSGEELLVLTAGKEALLKEQEPEEPGLSVVRTSSDGQPVVAAFYPLSGSFDRLAVSEGGRLAVAYYSSGQAASGVFRNPNEVGLLDLSQPAGPDNPVLRTVRSFGSAPHGVVFSPEMPVPAPDGPGRVLAVVLSEGYLTFLDMTHPRRREITVPLAKPDAATTVLPQQVIFSVATATVFVRAQGASDIYALSLLPRQPEEPDGNDFFPSINQPSSGKVPLDMILFSDGGRDLVLTANAQNDLSLVDAESSEFSIIPLGEPVDRILAVPAQEPRLALVFSQKQPKPRIHFLALPGLGAALEKNLVSRNLEQAVHQVEIMPQERQALVVHNDKRTVVSILNLSDEHQTVSPIQGQLPLESYDFIEGSHLVGVSRGGLHLGILELSNLHARNLRLDAPPASVLAIDGRVVVDHGASEGLVTVVPSVDADRAASHSLWGIFLGDMLDRELKD